MVVTYCYLERGNYKTLKLHIIPFTLKEAPPSFKCSLPIIVTP